MKRYVMLTVSIAGIGMALLLAIAYGTMIQRDQPSISTSTQASNWAVITLASTTVRVEVVSSKEDVQRGLSGRRTLREGTGMLFQMPETAHYAFWMPDMHFSIDIIWLDDQYRVVDVTEHLTPESYPQTYTSRVPARYVLEVPAGFVQAHVVTVGLSAVVGSQGSE